MALLRRQMMRATQALRRAGGGDDAPRWTIPKGKYHASSFQPTTPDKYFFRPHFKYHPNSTWMRKKKVAIEDIGSQVKATLTNGYGMTIGAATPWLDAQLPGIGFKAMAFASAAFTCGLLSSWQYCQMEYYVLMEKLHFYKKATELNAAGFWKSDAQELHDKQHAFEHDEQRLNKLFDDALSDATEQRSFDVLCSHLKVDPASLPDSVPTAISWRFSMLPYGRGNPDTETFAAPAHEQGRSAAFKGPDAGDYGDHVLPRDNKPKNMGKARHFYADVYYPGVH